MQIEDLIKQLQNVRAELGEQLQNVEAFRAIEQLDAREQAGEPLEAIRGDKLRQGLEAELASDNTYAAIARLDDAIAILSGQTIPARFAALEPTIDQTALVDDNETPAVAADEDREVVTEAEQGLIIPLQPQQDIPPVSPLEPAGDIDTPQEPDDLTLVMGIDPDMAARLAELGIAGFADIAAWTAADVHHIRSSLPSGDENQLAITTGGWIEQAAVLARGGETQFSRQICRGEFIPTVAMPTPIAPQHSIAPDASSDGALEANLEAPQVVEPERDEDTTEQPIQISGAGSGAPVANVRRAPTVDDQQVDEPFTNLTKGEAEIRIVETTNWQDGSDGDEPEPETNLDDVAGAFAPMQDDVEEATIEFINHDETAIASGQEEQPGSPDGMLRRKGLVRRFRRALSGGESSGNELPSEDQ